MRLLNENSHPESKSKLTKGREKLIIIMQENKEKKNRENNKSCGWVCICGQYGIYNWPEVLPWEFGGPESFPENLLTFISFFSNSFLYYIKLLLFYTKVKAWKRNKVGKTERVLPSKLVGSFEREREIKPCGLVG